MKTKIAIGTVQFGLDYGINNKRGILGSKELTDLLSFAHENDINILDTAYNYGNSEKRLGEILDGFKLGFDLISKAPKGTNSENFSKYFDESLERLKIKSFYGYLIHDFTDFEKDKKIGNLLNEQKEKSKVQNIGFSLYYPEQLEKLFEAKISFDLIQIPYNLIDRRFEKYFEELKRNNVEIHIRSVFLQGLFFMNPDELPSRLKPFEELLKKLIILKNVISRNIENIAINFAYQNKFIDYVVVGVEDQNQLSKNMNEVKNNLSDTHLQLLCNELEEIKVPIELLNPSNWN